VPLAEALASRAVRIKTWRATLAELNQAPGFPSEDRGLFLCPDPPEPRASARAAPRRCAALHTAWRQGGNSWLRVQGRAKTRISS